MSKRVELSESEQKVFDGAMDILDFRVTQSIGDSPMMAMFWKAVKETVEGKAAAVIDKLDPRDDE